MLRCDIRNYDKDIVTEAVPFGAVGLGFFFGVVEGFSAVFAEVVVVVDDFVDFVVCVGADFFNATH